jgi:hypothetical protein
VRRAVALTVILLVGIAIATYGLEVIPEQPAEAQRQVPNERCRGPSSPILRERGGGASTISRGYANYGPFTTTSDSFVVRLDASSSRPGGAAVVVGEVNDPANPGVIRRQAFQTPGTTSLLIQNGPGDYVVTVGFVGSGYTVTVEECTGGRASGPRATTPRATTPRTTTSTSVPAESSASATPSTPSRPPRDSTLDAGPDTDLFESGGPRSGPLPLMPDGGCPKEFPVKTKGACYE